MAAGNGTPGGPLAGGGGKPKGTTFPHPRRSSWLRAFVFVMTNLTRGLDDLHYPLDRIAPVQRKAEKTGGYGRGQKASYQIHSE